MYPDAGGEHVYLRAGYRRFLGLLYGWTPVSIRTAGEVRDPARNLARALIGGSLAVLVVYALVNLGYFHALPFGEVVNASSHAFPDAAPVAGKVAAEFLGSTTQVLLAGAMALSALS